MSDEDCNEGCWATRKRLALPGEEHAGRIVTRGLCQLCRRARRPALRCPSCGRAQGLSIPHRAKQEGNAAISAEVSPPRADACTRQPDLRRSPRSWPDTAVSLQRRSGALDRGAERKNPVSVRSVTAG